MAAPHHVQFEGHPKQSRKQEEITLKKSSYEEK
jgi:hypothetical protein